MLEKAQEYHDAGYSIIPIGTNKRPVISSWAEYQKHRPTELQIKTWWTNNPTANIGIITGRVSGGLVVVDVDKADNPWPEDPEERLTISDTEVVRTGGGGRHYFFKMPDDMVGGNSVGKLAKNVDTRGDGGYIIAPPSLHASGAYYEWYGDSKLIAASELPELPAWVVDRLSAAKLPDQKTSHDFESLLTEGVEKGQRNDRCASLAGHFLANGIGMGTVLTVLLDWNARNTPPLSKTEVEKTVQSIADRELLKQGQMAPVVSVDDGELDTETREQVLQAIREKFDINLESITRVGGDEPVYEFKINGNTAKVLAKDMTQWLPFCKAVTMTCEKMPESLDKKEKGGWRHWANMMMAAAERRSGEGATTSGNMASWLREFIEKSEPGENGKLLDFKCNFKKDGKVWISMDVFYKYARLAFGCDIKQTQMAQQFQLMGITPKKCHIHLESGAAKRLRRWGCDLNLLSMIDIRDGRDGSGQHDEE